jgi:putative ABC transport system permease protein
MAVRAALGSSRGRAVSQLLTESLTLGLLGGAAGLGLALALLRFLVRIMPSEVPRLNLIGLDVRLLAFSFVVSLLAGILFGLAPALQLSRTNLTGALNEGGREGTSAGKRHNRVRAALAVSEIALAVVLLISAGLLIKSFLRLTRVELGFDPHNVLAFQLDPPAGKPLPESPAFYREVVTRMTALPGAVSASAVVSLPLTGDNIRSSMEIEGQPTPMGSRPIADFNAIDLKYFHAMGIRLVAGRDFTENDNPNSPPVVIVNEALARRFFPDQNPIGKHVRPGVGNGYPPGQEPMREIVGVAGNVKQSDLGTEPFPEIYAPLAQSPFDSMIIVVRTRSDPRTIVEPARRAVASIDRQLPLYHVLTLDQYFADSVSEPRLITLLLSGFAGLAVILACLGVYGVISYIVIQRRHEIGIRMALGAETSEILRWVLNRGLWVTSAGVAIGLAASLSLSHLLSNLLYGVRPTDPVIFVAAPLALFGVALLASFVPARRAARVDPVVALRCQ